MRVALAALFAGCGGVGLDPLLGETGAAGGGPPVRIDALVPDRGPTAGGTEVVVTGAGFEGDVSFWFGGTEVDVSVISPEELVVTTPAVPVEASVDVRVRSDLGEAELADAFTFTDAAGDDTGGGGGGGGGGSGRIAGLVELDYVAVGCPACFGLTSPLQVTGSAVFHDPVDGSWADWLPPAGSCVVDPERTPPTTQTLDVGEHVYLEYGTSRSIDLRRTADSTGTSYLSAALGQDDYVRNAAYDLEVPGGDDVGAFSAPGALRTSTSIESLEPIELFYDAPQAFQPLSASNARFTWSPSGASDAVVVDIVVYNAQGTAQEGEILCVSDDVGSLTVPSSAFSGFASGDLAAVWFYRLELARAERDLDGAVIEGASAFGALGTATLRP